MKLKLAEAILRRKELQAKVEQLHQIKDDDMLYHVRARRIRVTEYLDDMDAEFPKLTAAQVTAEYDYYASALRKIDALIQQTNWTAEIDVEDRVMTPWSEGNKK